LSREEVVEFFENYVKYVEGVPPENLYNFNESPLRVRDDTGSSSCIYRKGTKYPEKVQNSSEKCIYVMFCGNGVGEMVPPMVVYNAKNLYTSWKGEDGGASRVLSTQHSCLDSLMFQFEKWFVELLLPILKKKLGKKLIIVDILASHISHKQSVFTSTVPYLPT
jgi:hypothetical protein